MTWTGFFARISAVMHRICHPTHKMVWRTDPVTICDGDIICRTCDMIFWCRSHDLSAEELERRIQVMDNIDCKKVTYDIIEGLRSGPYQDLSDVGNIIGIALNKNNVCEYNANGNDLKSFIFGINHGMDI